MRNSDQSRRRHVRWFLAVLAIAGAALTGLVGGLIPGSSVDAEYASAEAVPAGTRGVIRYFGRGAYEGIRKAVAATPRSCGLSDDGLTALVMAPIFKEVSMGETPQTAPSPMTLSRYDEWSGVWSGSNNLNANFGLYAFRDPNTRYRRAYWTPGIGIFQYDVAGVGAPYTAAELTDVQFVASKVAAGMAERYCATPGSAFARRSAAWEPWSGLNGIAKSEALFKEMLGRGHPPFSTIGLVDGIDNAGGVIKHRCTLGGRTLVDCWYVNPYHAQGANWWANVNLDGGAPTGGEAPLTAAFYVVRNNGYEERHWMAQDTRYDRSISARRVLGENARPRDGQPRSGLEWYGGSTLCDLDRPSMRCPTPPQAAKPAAKPQPAAQPKTPPAVPKPEAADKGKPNEPADSTSIWETLAGLTVTAPAAARNDKGKVEADTQSDTPPANSTFSFAKGLALVPPASR